MLKRRIEDLNILIVENQGPTQDIIATVLGTLETTRVYKARNAGHALAMYQTKGHDIIIVEMDLDPTDGIELARSVRGLKGSFSPSNVPIILMARYMDQKTIERAKSEGVTDILIKPFSFDDLTRHINTAMGKARGGRSHEESLQGASGGGRQIHGS